MLRPGNLADRGFHQSFLQADSKLAASEMQGGTFTVTSLGAFGIDAFTPIINYPECAILGVGRIRRCPAVFEDQKFERRLRDIHTVSQQSQGRQLHSESVGQIMLGLPPENQF